MTLRFSALKEKRRHIVIMTNVATALIRWICTMQLSFRLDKRPGESHLALDGKKTKRNVGLIATELLQLLALCLWPLAMRSQSPGPSPSVRHKVFAWRKWIKVGDCLTINFFNATGEDHFLESKATRPNSMCSNRYHCQWQLSHHRVEQWTWHSRQAHPSHSAEYTQRLATQYCQGPFIFFSVHFFSSGMADNALRLGPYMRRSRLK